MKISRAQSGFTLLEIMVAVALIMITLAVVIPNFLTYRSSSHVSSCQANMNLIAHSCEMHFLRTGTAVTDVSQLCNRSLGVVYMKTVPTCPIHGSYTINFDSQNQRFHVTCSAFDSSSHNVHQDGD